MANLIVKITNGTEIRRFTATNDTLTTSLAQIETINKRAADTKQIEDEAMCKKIKREQDVLADMQANRRAKKIKTKTST